MASHTSLPFLGFVRALPLVLACLAATPALANDQAFEGALQSYRTGRLSDAYGRMLTLAHKGDPDAARIVLFMGQYGPILHGTFWELTARDATAFRKTAQRPSLRPQPMPNPAGYDNAPSSPTPFLPENLAGR